MIKATLLILEEDNKIIFGKRSETKQSLPGKWSLPSETMKADEPVEEAAVRCAKEELDLDISNVTIFDSFHFNDGNEDKILYFVKATYTGTPIINDPDELTALKYTSFKNFFATHPDVEIGHGLQYLRKKFGF
jgi:ADP-ribose pyrophosphatase YjhB (NUDIX family)